jgi:periplasmic protein TonB
MTSLLDAPPPSTGAASLGALAVTALTYGAIVALVSYAGVRGVTQFKQALPVTEMIEVELPKPPPPPAEAPKPESLPVPSPRIKAAPEPPSTPPSAAEAGQILDAKSEAVDFGDKFVTGDGNGYAGGDTDRKGTSKTAVHDASARGDGAGNAAKTVVAPVVDLSRPPRLAGSAQWRCPFPIEADDAGIDHAVVTLRVEIGVNGAVRTTTVVADAGNGFGREARRCAQSSPWLPALDHTGHAIPGSATVNVRFDR